MLCEVLCGAIVYLRYIVDGILRTISVIYIFLLKIFYQFIRTITSRLFACGKQINKQYFIRFRVISNIESFSVIKTPSGV